MDANIKFKDSVFSLLFSDPDLLRELYCALENVTLPPDTPVKINTLENVLFKDKINDISFEIGGKLVVLIEHQSTINENMALRLHMYITRVYEKILEGKNIYSKNRILIPRSEFFVLYNGKDPYPDEEIIRLSDSFIKVKSLGLDKKNSPSLELVVRVLNINEGQNKEIAERCKKLSEYSAFVAKEREFEKELGNREEALKATVQYCQKHDILKEFLESHGSEVLNMLLTEWNIDDAIAVAREEGCEEGEERGSEKAKLAIARNLFAEGSTLDFVQKITGLDLDTIKGLQADL